MRTSRFKKLTPKYIRTKRRRWLRLKNHPFVVPVVTFLILLAATGVGFIFLNSQTVSSGTSHIVILTDTKSTDSKIKETIPTSAPTVGELLSRLHVKLNDGDIVEPAANTPIVEDNYRVNIYRAQPITIVQGSHRTFTFSAATTPRSIAVQAGVKVYPEDNLSIKIPENILRNASIGKELIIDAATPVYLNLYGTPVPVRTHAKTVGDLIKEKQITLAASDNVQPGLNTPITSGMFVAVARHGTQIITQSEDIPVAVQIIEDNSLSFGTTVVRQQGSPGKKLVTYQINMQNGKEVSRQKIQEVIAEQPVPEIIARGKAISIPADKSAWMSAAGISSSDYAYVNYIISRESGWCPTKLQGHPGSCPGFAPDYIPNYLGYGLGQATPGNKMAEFGGDWQTNPVTQLRWASSYADSRYGSWAGAYNFWSAHSYW